MNNVDVGSFIPERWVQRVRSVDGVARAEPYVVMFSQATLPDGRFENVIVVGCDAASLLGNAWDMADGDAAAVRDPDGILVDVCDRPKLANCRIGDYREINGRRAKIVGMTRGVVGFTTDPYVFTTLERARTKFATTVPPGQCSYFLIRAHPGENIPNLCARIQQRVPELDVYDKAKYSRMCAEYWLTRTGIGISFGLAAFLGMLVGLAVVVSGFAFITPSLNSLLSRWSDPTEQGGILGIGQSISSLARIVGPMAGVPLFENRALAESWGVKAAQLPLLLATVLMALGLLLVIFAARSGRDFQTSAK